MPFDTLIGHAKPKQYLKNLLQNDTWGCPLLFAGQRAVGKALAAQLLAQELLGCAGTDHPDLRIVRPEGKTAFHQMESLRQVRDEAQQAPYQADRRVIILDEADRVRPEGANALLKTFEEPLESTLLILISSQPERLLSTILSRCQMVRFAPVAQQEMAQWLQQRHKIDASHAQLASQLAEGAPGLALQLAHAERDGGRTTLLQVLARGGFRNYAEMQQFLQEVEQGTGIQPESVQQAEGVEVSAVQKAALLKQEDGRKALATRSELDWLFHSMALWFRDLELHNVGAPNQQLAHQDFAESSCQAFQQGQYRPMTEVLSAIETARTSLERSSPVAATLEALFLRLGLG